MRAARFVSWVSFLASLSISTQAPASEAAYNNLDMAGLKLGMTFDQAKQALETYNSSIHIRYLFATDNRAIIGLWGDRGVVSPDDDAILNKSKIKVPIALIADIPQGGAQPHEVFTLRFTPNDTGGDLYAVGRLVKYTGRGESPQELARKFIEKYGSPTLESNGQIALNWIYDQKGKKLNVNSRFPQQCVASGISTISFGKMDVPWFSTVTNYQSRLSPYQSCGAEVVLDSDFNGQYVTGFISSLTDNKIANYDNGIQEYMERKLRDIGDVPPMSSAPKL